MDRGRLKEILLDQRAVFNQTKGLINRNIELDGYIKTGLLLVYETEETEILNNENITIVPAWKWLLSE